MKGFAIASLVGMLASASPGLAQNAKPLRHLAFDVGLEVTYISAQGGLRDVADPMGGGTVETQRGDTFHSRILCDVVDVNQQTGDLMLSVAESGDRTAPATRLILRLDGSLGFLANQPPLTDEESALVPLLARGYIGSTMHPVNDNWVVTGDADKYKSTTKFRVTSVHPPDAESLVFDEEFAYSGAQGFTGSAHGDVSYDPAKLVPDRLKLTLTRRLSQLGAATTVRYQADYTLKEDSFSSHS